ncbi:hypothetical protein IGI50_004018 [Enterococcus sp. DIV0170]
MQKYEYDSLGQVTQMTVSDKNKKKELANYAYSYDLAGNKSMKERWTKFCKTAPKAKKAQTSKEKEREDLERLFGPANKADLYYVPWEDLVVRES